MNIVLVTTGAYAAMLIVFYGAVLIKYLIGRVFCNRPRAWWDR